MNALSVTTYHWPARCVFIYRQVSKTCNRDRQLLGSAPCVHFTNAACRTGYSLIILYQLQLDSTASYICAAGADQQSTDLSVLVSEASLQLRPTSKRPSCKQQHDNVQDAAAALPLQAALFANKVFFNQCATWDVNLCMFASMNVLFQKLKDQPQASLISWLICQSSATHFC